jgi:hypothetical protein
MLSCIPKRIRSSDMPKDLEVLITNMEPLEKAMESNDREAISNQLRIAAESLRNISDSQTFFSAVYRNGTPPEGSTQIQISKLANRLNTWGWTGHPILDDLYSLTTPTKDEAEEAWIRAGLRDFAKNLDDLSTKVIIEDVDTWKSALHQLWLSLRRIVISLCGIALIGQELFAIEGTVPWIATVGTGLLVSSLDEFLRWKSEQGPSAQPSPGTHRYVPSSIDPKPFGFAAPGKVETLGSFSNPTVQPSDNSTDSGLDPGL